MKNRWSSESKKELALILPSHDRGRAKYNFAQRISPYEERKKIFPFLKNFFGQRIISSRKPMEQ
ncbi:MAG: hypothetical protein IK000_06190 [Bacteroidaceae bacterium]|nr:hypothetical protein [Bacteroidaceae bacterium]